MNKMELVNQSENVRVGNIMQIELANIHGEALDEFVDKHAEDFRKILQNNPEILEDYKYDPKGVLEKIGTIIYH